VALWLRARCTVELLEQWPLCVAWFGESGACDVLSSLVGANENSQRDGFAWPVAEAMWLLANVLRRRVVVVRKLQQRTAAVAGGDRPFVVLPVRHAADQWLGAAGPATLECRPLPAAQCPGSTQSCASCRLAPTCSALALYSRWSASGTANQQRLSRSRSENAHAQTNLPFIVVGIIRPRQDLDRAL